MVFPPKTAVNNPVDNGRQNGRQVSMEYTLYQIADLLGVHFNTVKRYAREAGATGTLEKREEGGNVRLYSEQEFHQIRDAVDRRVDRSESTALAPSQVQEIVRQAVDTVNKESTAQIQRLKTDMETLLANMEEFREQWEKETRRREEEARKREETHQAELVEIREKLAASHRETEALQEELRRPWWARLFHSK